MVSVEIKELESRLSEYVARACDGERVLITDRGREVAELHPVSAARKTVQRLAKAGKVEWSGGKPEGLKGVRAHGEPVAGTVLEDRQ